MLVFPIDAVLLELLFGDVGVAVVAKCNEVGGMVGTALGSKLYMMDFEIGSINFVNRTTKALPRTLFYIGLLCTTLATSMLIPLDDEWHDVVEVPRNRWRFTRSIRVWFD